MNINKQGDVLYALDLGNTRAKILSSDFALKNFNYRDIDKLVDYLLKKAKKIKKPRKLVIYFSSVNTLALIKIMDALRSDNTIVLVPAFAVIKNNQRIDFDEIQGIGQDRVFGLLGSLDNYPLPLATIDCGTAVTINIMNEELKVIGGVILPGFNTQAKSLFDNTSKLPFVSIPKYSQKIGKSTQKAIQSGIFNSILGGIKETISYAEKYFFDGGQLSLVFTGGDSPLFFKEFKEDRENVFHDPYLVLKGIMQAASYIR